MIHSCLFSIGLPYLSRIGSLINIQYKIGVCTTHNMLNILSLTWITHKWIKYIKSLIVLYILKSDLQNIRSRFFFHCVYWCLLRWTLNILIFVLWFAIILNRFLIFLSLWIFPIVVWDANLFICSILFIWFKSYAISLLSNVTNKECN